MSTPRSFDTFTFAVASALAALAGTACSGSSEALVKRCLDAHGGVEVIRANDKLVERGTVTSLLHPGPGQIARAFERPGRLRVETAYPDGTGEVRVLDRFRGWRDQTPVEGARLDAMVLQAARLDVVGLLADPEVKLTEHPAWTIDGRAVRVLSLFVRPGMELEVGIDPETARVVRTRTMAAETGRPIEFITTYSDYRPVNGLLVAFREENWANGATTGETVLESVEVLPVLEPVLFQPN